MKRACKIFTHNKMTNSELHTACAIPMVIGIDSVTPIKNKKISHIKLLSLILVFLFSFSAYAQYTEVINSKRPGFAESPFALGTKVYQIESGYFFHKNDKPDFFTKKKSQGLNLFLRSGFISEKLEINANFKLQKDDLLSNIVTGTTYPNSGISQFTVGAKYLFYMPNYKDPSKEIRSWKAKMAFDWRRFIPSVGLYAGLNTNLLSSDYKETSMSPKAIILLQNDFSDELILVTNIVGDYLTLNEKRTYGYITTLTYAVTPKVSIFGEHQGMFTRYTKNYELGGGLAYLINEDLQFGLNVRTDSQFDYLNIYGSLGLSWRMDNHKDKEIRLKGNSDGSGKIQHKEGFFKRLFSKKSRRPKPPKKSRYRKIRTRKPRS